MQLTDVAVRYGRGEPWVLQDVSLGLDPGDVVELSGSNGAGKSSLLLVLAGVLAHRRGSVTGRPQVVGWAPERFEARQPHTVEAYLTAQARMRGVPPGPTIEVALGRLDGLQLLRTRLPDLSKGSAQKVGIAQALLTPPGLLVLDEPWSGLDAEAQTALPEIVAEVAGAGGIVVVTDHQRRAVQLPLTRRWHASEGTVRETTPPAAALPAEAIVEVRLPAARAEALARELRVQGHDARVRP